MIKVVHSGMISQCRSFAEAELLSASAGEGTLILAPRGWEIWKEGLDYPDDKDYCYHIWVLYIKDIRRERLKKERSNGL